MTERITVMGAGAWGTTYAQICSDAGHETVLWARRNEIVEEINNSCSNDRYLPGVQLHSGLRATTDPEVALGEATVVALAIPSSELQVPLRQWGGHVPPAATVVSLVKGIDETSERTPSQLIGALLGRSPSQVVAVAGPNSAWESARRLPGAALAVSSDPTQAQRVATISSTSYFRLHPQGDILGCEVVAAATNVMAIAVGISLGMRLGDNAKAAIITRGLIEASRLSIALGAEPGTLLGLAGVGDIVHACNSPHMPERRLGERLGRKPSVPFTARDADLRGEGARSVRPLVRLATRARVEVPIMRAVAEILFTRASPRRALRRVMDAGPESELEGLNVGGEYGAAS